MRPETLRLMRYFASCHGDVGVAARAMLSVEGQREEDRPISVPGEAKRPMTAAERQAKRRRDIASRNVTERRDMSRDNVTERDPSLVLSPSEKEREERPSEPDRYPASVTNVTTDVTKTVTDVTSRNVTRDGSLVALTSSSERTEPRRRRPETDLSAKAVDAKRSLEALEASWANGGKS